MNKLIEEIEFQTGLGPTKVAKLLGIAYVTYTQYSSESRQLPKYIEYHIDTLLRLPQTELDAVIKSRVYVGVKKHG